MLIERAMKYLMLLFLVAAAAFANAQQTPPLERKVTIDVTNETVTNVLTMISKQAAFSFSYNPSLVDGSRRVTMSLRARTVREALNIVFPGNTVSFRSKGNYIILGKGKQAEELTSAPPKECVIDGYILDKLTGETVANASVYEKNTLIATTTNMYGYYMLKVPAADINELSVYVDKTNYNDTVVVLKPKAATYQNIAIDPFPVSAPEVIAASASADSSYKKVEDLPIASFLVPNDAAVNAENIPDTIYNKVQVSFLPFIGSTHKLSGRMINDYSLNIIGGYALGSRRAEIAGMFNIDRGQVTGFQAAGFANFVGKGTDGFQGAGFMNMIGGDMRGVQAAGFGNTVLRQAKGVQAAGFYNFSYRNFEGVQAAGFINFVADTVKGAQVAGFTNITRGTVDGVQAAGFLNYANSVKGGQVAGFANVSPVVNGPQVAGFSNTTVKISGPQVAGFMNIARDKVRGVQVSGFLNAADTLKGIQVGFINIADTCEAGMQLGFLNIVKKGYHRLELSLDERMFTELAFKTGTHRFYNIFSAGINIEQEQQLGWTAGYGIGTASKPGRKWAINLDASGRTISFDNWSTRTSTLGTIALGVERRIVKGLAIAVSPEANVYIIDKSLLDSNPAYYSIVPYYSFRKDYTDVRVTGWVGGKIALRFL